MSIRESTLLKLKIGFNDIVMRELGLDITEDDHIYDMDTNTIIQINEKFIKYCKELDIVNLINDIDKIVGDTKFDVEAETCALGCEMIIKRFNGDERSFDEMKVEYINKIKEKIKNDNERASSDNTNEWIW